MKMFVRFRFHLSSGVRVDRYNSVKEGEVMTTEDLNDMHVMFKHGMINLKMVDKLSGFFIPDIANVLLVEVDVVDETKVPTDA